MPTFHVVPVPGAGHVNPVLPVAAELVRRGEDVEVWLPPSFAAAAQSTGARYRQLPEFDLPVPGRGRPSVRHARQMMRLLRVPPPGLPAALRPGDVVLHDAMGSWARRLAGAPVSTVAFATTTVTDGASMAADLARPLARLLRGDPDRLQQRLLASPLPRLLDRIPLPMSARGGLTLVAVPRAFQPRGEAFGPEFVFVGPCIEPRPLEATDPLPADLADESRPVVLVSLGSAFNFRPAFYRACFRAFDGAPWRVVMAIGQHTDPAALGPPPENVTTTARVPQLRLLGRASAFVSHGGMGSVLESLSAGVPLVLFPQMPEQRANARRVAEHGAGVVLSRTPDPTEIRSAVARVLTDPAVAPAVAELGAAARTAGGQHRAADVLQEVARSHAGTAGSAGPPAWVDIAGNRT